MSIWHQNEIPGYDRSKENTPWSKWRYLVMERLTQKTGLGEGDAVDRLHAYGIQALGIDFDNNLTAEELADKLAEDRYRVVT